MTVGDLSSRIGSRELSEWQEYYRGDPWDRQRSDWHLAQIATVMYNMWWGKDSPARDTREFMLHPYPEREQSVEEQIGLLKASLPRK